MNPKETAWTLTAAVLGALGVLAYRGRIVVGDVVEVPTKALVGALPPPPGFNQDEHAAIQVTQVNGDTLVGFLRSLVHDGEMGSPAPPEAQIKSYPFPRSSVVKKF